MQVILWRLWNGILAAAFLAAVPTAHQAVGAESSTDASSLPS
jgi:hypothetical protein